MIALLACGVVAQAGCQAMWHRVREGERNIALKSARTQAQRGQCGKALSSLDRAEATMEIGVYAREAIAARVRCYEKLGLQELASAHRRLLTDFYTEEPMALPEADGSSVFRVRNLEPDDYQPPPATLKISRPRYTPYAQRSKIVGRVVLSFELTKNGTPRKIRVLEMPHPLLATWAIEAVTQAELKKPKSGKAPLIAPRSSYVTTFVFEWRWAQDEDEEDDGANPS